MPGLLWGVHPMGVTKHFTIYCPICGTTARVAFEAGWRCAASEKHEPVYVKGPFSGADQ